MNHFNPVTVEEEANLLKYSNVENFSDLINIIPESLILNKEMGIGNPMSEMEIEQESYGVVITDKIERESDGQTGMFPYVWAYMFDTCKKRRIEITHNIRIISNS